MLAFVMLWAYFSFSQFLIIWSANLPEEIPVVLEAHGRRLAMGRPGADLRPLRAAVRAAAVARPQAERPHAHRRGARRHRDALVDLFWNDRPDAPTTASVRRCTGSTRWRRSRSAASGSPCSSGSCSRDRCCRSASRIWPRRSSTAGTGTDSRKRQWQIDANADRLSRRRAHELSDADAGPILRFLVFLVVTTSVIAADGRRLLQLPRAARGAEKTARYPMACRRRARRCRRRRGCRTIRSRTSRICGGTTSRCSTATSGSTRTPARSGSRSSGRWTCSPSVGFRIASRGSPQRRRPRPHRVRSHPGLQQPARLPARRRPPAVHRRRRAVRVGVSQRRQVRRSRSRNGRLRAPDSWPRLAPGDAM